MTRDELLAEIEEARPPHYFDDVRGLLLHFVELRLAIGELWPRLHRTKPGTRRSTALTIEKCTLCEWSRELGETLHLFDRSLPPPRLQ